MCEKDISHTEVFTGASRPGWEMCSFSCMAFSSGAQQLTLSPFLTLYLYFSHFSNLSLSLPFIILYISRYNLPLSPFLNLTPVSLFLLSHFHSLFYIFLLFSIYKRCPLNVLILSLSISISSFLSPAD